jgi:hypothetical protein
MEETPTTLVLDGSRKGAIFFSSIAVHFPRKNLAQNKGVHKDTDLTLVSSLAGFGEWHGLFVYSSSKHIDMSSLGATKISGCRPMASEG